jgi:metal-sulfur cluster biosynthetic enzyme
VNLEARTLAALDGVYDPELDEPVTALGFVSACEISDAGDAAVRLRLPTPQCAPNFAFLMAADARAAVRRVPGVRRVRVMLEDHYTGDEINAALVGDGDFADAFPGETRDDLDALRELFFRKALVARQARVFERLRDAGATDAQLVAMTLADLPGDDPDARRSRELRASLGLPSEPVSPAFVAGDGSALDVADVATWLRRGRLLSLSIETNGGMCRDLLRVRHGVAEPEEVPA